jgi:membrane protein DedA with SNARE-associated domain
LLLIDKVGYLGIFVGMLIESTFIPLPSETILIPAGALVAQGKMSFLIVFLVAVAGSLVGALINYSLALFLGRPIAELFIRKYGKVFFLSNKKLNKVDKYFENHGQVTTFIGRLIPGVRHLISIPAGFAKMNLTRFCIFTSLGAGFWSLVLIFVGYSSWKNINFINANFNQISIIFVAISFIIFAVYVYRKKIKKRV